MGSSCGSVPEAGQMLTKSLTRSSERPAQGIKLAGTGQGLKVRVSIFANGTHGKFNERTHRLYTKRVVTSAQERRAANNAFENFDWILVSVLVSALVPKEKARSLTPLACAFDGGRYKIRTCDPIRVKDMLYP